MSSNPERQTNPDPKTIESLLNDCIKSLSLPMIKKILDSERAKLFKDNPTPYLNEILKNGLKKLDKEPYLTSLKKDIIIVKLILNERKERKDRVIMTQQKLKTVIPSQLNALFKLPPKNASLEDLENYHCQITLALATYDRRTKLPSTLAENLKIVRARINALKQREKNINSFSKPIPVISTVKNSRLIESKIHIEAVAGDSLHSIFKEHFSFLFPKGYDFKNVRILKNKGNNHYEIFLGRIKPGDIVYFQYGSLIIKKSSDRESPKNFKTKPPNKIRRREEITSAIETMEENGVTFYFVKKGDTIFRIFQNLIKKDPAKFEYLRGKHEKCFKLTYMNIPTKYLPENEWVPIPRPIESREISDQDFIEQARGAIKEMLNNKEYSTEIQKIKDSFSTEEEFLTFVLSVAKQESGDRPMGHYALFRWEPHVKCFSYSYFHILMKDNGSGVKAMKNLNMKVSETFNPKDSTKLFLAYLIENVRSRYVTPEGKVLKKSVLKKIDKLLPLKTQKDFEEFAAFYNGSEWRKNNYANKLIGYMKDTKITVTNSGTTSPSKS